MAKGKTFKGFSDEQMKRIAGKLGFQGPVENFGQFLQSNPAMAAKYAGLEAKARMKFQVGGMVPAGQQLAATATNNATPPTTPVDQSIEAQIAAANKIASTPTPSYLIPQRVMALRDSALQKADVGVGQGTALKQVPQEFSQGNITLSGNEIDLGVTGQGFFPLRQPDGQGDDFIVPRGGFPWGDDIGKLPDRGDDIGKLPDINNFVNAMSDEERRNWAQNRSIQKDLKSPEEQALINSVLRGEYRPAQPPSTGVGPPTTQQYIPQQQPYGPLIDPNTGEPIREEIMRPAESDFERFGIDTSAFDTYANKLKGQKSTGGTLSYDASNPNQGIFGSPAAMTGTNADTVRAMLRIFDQYTSKSGNTNISPKIDVTYGANSNEFDLKVDGKSVGKFNNTQQGMSNAGQALIRQFNNQFGGLEENEMIGTGEYNYAMPTVGDISGQRIYEPGLPEGGTQLAQQIEINERQKVAEGTGQVTGDRTAGTSQVTTAAQATASMMPPTSTYDATQVSGQVGETQAATGQVSQEAQVQAAQGEVSTGALAEAPEFDEKYMKEIQAGERKVTSGELVRYAEANNIPASEAAKMLEPYLDVEAAKFIGEMPKAEAQDIYSLKPTEVARQTATKVQDAAKAAEIPTAEAAQSQFQSTMRAAQGRVGSNELVNAKDIVATEKAVTAVAATMNAVNEDAIAVAATGSFSQAALAKAAQGTVSPQSTVQGQMASLMEQFNDGTPAWAAGAMRAANAAMAARGLGASSMAGAAIVQATMESALPIAQQDAQAFQAMDMANLNSRQQVALANAAAQQNIELSNLNNRQQAALQNSANAFALQSQNLSNEQAVVLANAQMKAALQGQIIDVKTSTALANAAKFAEMNKLNLTNQQQANLTRSAQNLEIEIANLSNTQQTALSNLQVRAALRGQELSNEQQVAMLRSTQDFGRAAFDASAKQQAFLQDAQAQAALEGRAMDVRQQTQLFNVSSLLEERQIELNNEQQTRIFNASNRLQIDVAELSNRQQTALANAQIEAALRGQELSNKQQAAVLNAEKFAEANNLTFTAQQQAQLQNSSLMQSIGLANLNTKQATALQNAATLAAMDMANLDNRQQAAVQNAQAFLQMDMTNLSNEQQAVMFDSQSRLQALFSDQAADNAAKNFNASSQNQTDQFFAQLATTVSQFNATQTNALTMFNAEEANDIAQFNAQIGNERDQFNAGNELLIAQSFAQWNRDVATANTAAVNIANQNNAQAILGISEQAYANMFNLYADSMEYAWTSGENERDRINNIALARLRGEIEMSLADFVAEGQALSDIGGFLATAALGYGQAQGFFNLGGILGGKR